MSPLSKSLEPKKEMTSAAFNPWNFLGFLCWVSNTRWKPAHNTSWICSIFQPGLFPVAWSLFPFSHFTISHCSAFTTWQVNVERERCQVQLGIAGQIDFRHPRQRATPHCLMLSLLCFPTWALFSVFSRIAKNCLFASRFDAFGRKKIMPRYPVVGIFLVARVVTWMFIQIHALVLVSPSFVLGRRKLIPAYSTLVSCRKYTFKT